MSLKTAQTSISANSLWDVRHILFMMVDEKITPSEMTRCVHVTGKMGTLVLWVISHWLVSYFLQNSSEQVKKTKPKQSPHLVFI